MTGGGVQRYTIGNLPKSRHFIGLAVTFRTLVTLPRVLIMRTKSYVLKQRDLDLHTFFFGICAKLSIQDYKSTCGLKVVKVSNIFKKRWENN